MTDEPKKRGRAKGADKPPALDSGAEREQVVAWMRSRIDAIEADAAARVALAQTDVQHPNPIYQRLVKHYAAVGFKPQLICQLLMMKPTILREYYGEELTLGPAQINLKMAETLMTIGFDPMHPQAASVAFKWLERMHPDESFKPPAQRLKVSDDREKERVIDSSTLPPEDRAQLKEILERKLLTDAAEPEEESEDKGDDDGTE